MRDRTDDENRNDIDDANAAHFHMIARQVRRRRHEFRAFERLDPRDIVGKRDCSRARSIPGHIRFFRPARAANDNADAEYIDHAANSVTVERNPVRAAIVAALMNFMCHGCAENGDSVSSQPRAIRCEMKSAGGDETRDFLRAESAKTLAPTFVTTFQIRLLRCTEPARVSRRSKYRSPRAPDLGD